RDPSSYGAGNCCGMCEGQDQRNRGHFGRFQGKGCGRGGAGTANPVDLVGKRDAPDWPELPGTDESVGRPERNVCSRYGAAGECSFSEPKRRAVNRDPGLEPG